MTCRVEVDAARCTGCRACMLTCSLRRTGEARLSASAIRVFSAHDEGAHAPIVCVSCASRPCVAVCPVGAIQDAEDTPILDVDRCIGCTACVTACPFGAIGFDTVSQRAVKCDLCGGTPLCVEVCNAATTMPGALALTEGPLSEASTESATHRLRNAQLWRDKEMDHAG